MHVLTRKLLLMLATALLPLAMAHANDLANMRSIGVIKIGTEGTYPPFSYHDANNTLTGFDVEIGRAIARKLGLRAIFVEGKWDGLIAGLDIKRYDAVINQVGITAARKKKYAFSDAYISSEAVLIVRDDEQEIQQFADLKGRRSANTLTSNFGQLAQNHGAEVVPVQSFNEAIELLLSGRVRATVNDKLSFLDFKKKKPNAPVHIAARDRGEAFSESGVLLRKGDPALVRAINQALREIKVDGTYQRISEQYFGTDLSAAP